MFLHLLTNLLHGFDKAQALRPLHKVVEHTSLQIQIEFVVGALEILDRIVDECCLPDDSSSVPGLAVYSLQQLGDVGTSGDGLGVLIHMLCRGGGVL